MTEWVKSFFGRRNNKGFGVHSPFVYELITEVIHEKKDYVYIKVSEKLTEEKTKRTKKLLKLWERLINKYGVDEPKFFINFKVDDAYAAEVLGELEENRDKRTFMLLDGVRRKSMNKDFGKIMSEKSQVEIQMNDFTLYVLDSKLQKGKYYVKV
ncbi:MAG: hypothetical protein LBM07_04170 [Culturomica sp.]|jgi:hypothetical protein|nr:hypothetical protein [Culturomica sp.]